MIYKAFQDEQLSMLGLGCMRLPTLGNYATVDQATVDRMVDTAIKRGVNYFDTAWGYHDGHSEAAIGKALSRYPRESYNLATKFPGYDLSNMDKVEEIFEAQLRRCGVTYFDYYLFHNVCEMNIDAYLDESHGIFAYLMKQKEAGRIRHLGFSAHGSKEVITRFLDKYGEHMEFGQLQLNWLDWTFQNAKEKAELLQSRGLPVWVMEPVRGGKLCTLSDEDTAKLKALRPDESVTAWAFRFLQTVPGITMVLSGMSNEEQLNQNLDTFEASKPLNDAEMEALADLAKDMIRHTAVPCTACRYCTTHCPRELDIPHLLSLYNEHAFTGGGFIAPMALSALPKDKWPSACIGCGKCKQVCPQMIDIPGTMKQFTRMLG